jgi:hypothetical protein
VEMITLSWLQIVMEMIEVSNFETPNCPIRMSMIWTSLYWKSLKYALVFIQLKYCDLQYRAPMLNIVGWNTMCTRTIIQDVFCVGFLVCTMWPTIYTINNIVQ